MCVESKRVNVTKLTYLLCRAAEAELEKIQSIPEREQNRLSQLNEHLQAQVRALTRERDEIYASFQR